MLLVIHLVITGVFVLFGIVLSCRKGGGLIAGYNTGTAAEKAKYDEKKLCKGMAKLMFALAGCWLVVASSELFKITALLWIGLCLFVAVLVAGVIYMNTGNRFKR